MKSSLLLILFSGVIYGQTTPSEGPLFDKEGHRLGYIYSDGSMDRYSYDSAWRMLSFTSRDGTKTFYTYNGDGSKNAKIVSGN